jgi:CubicO group peptidase (beta-lactamase class C family)
VELTDDDRLGAVQAFLSASMQRKSAPRAFGVAVIRGGSPCWSKTFGREDGARFQAGSISKTVTAAAALELVARGELQLDLDVDDRLTSWRIGVPTTLRDLLGHTAGVNVPFYPGYEPGSAIPTVVESLEGLPPTSTPGVSVELSRRGSFSYSGGAYVVVQQLIADVAGASFVEAARYLVLDPVGMDCSTFRQPLPPEWQHSAAREDSHLYPEAGAGGLWTTPLDLAKFISAIQQANGDGAHGLSAMTSRTMLAMHAPLPKKGQWSLLPWLGIRPPEFTGLGLFLMGEDRFANIGGAFRFFSMIVGSGDAGAVVMSASDAHPLIFETLQAISEAEQWSGLRVEDWMKKRLSKVALRALWHKKPA